MQTTNTGSHVIAWHYTIGLKLPLIRESGVLRPTDACIPPDERPVCWFSTAAHWEQTAAKMRPCTPDEYRGPKAKDMFPDPLSGRWLRRCNMQETAEIGEGLYRFGLPASELIRWPEVGKLAGIRAKMRGSLMKTGRLQGAEPPQWYGTFKEIPLAKMVMQQLIDFRYWAGKERLQHRDQQLAAIATCEVRVCTVPLAELRKIAGDDRECVNYARHRGTNYHKLLEWYDAGDRAILHAIRARIYNAIASAYTELADECDRQLKERL